MKALDLRDVAFKLSFNSNSQDGTLYKTIYNINNKDYYIKLSDYTEGIGITGFESIYEVIAYRLADKLGISCADQELLDSYVTLKEEVIRTYACISASFLNEGESRLTVKDFYSNMKQDSEEIIELIKRFNFQEFIYKMFLFDYIILNMDRHGANVEIIKDKFGQYKPAPLFDNGMSFLYLCINEKEIESFDIMNNSTVNNYIGHSNTLDNLELIDQDIYINELRDSDMVTIFQDLGNILSKTHIDNIWNMIMKRYELARKKGVFKIC